MLDGCQGRCHSSRCATKAVSRVSRRHEVHLFFSFFFNLKKDADFLQRVLSIILCIVNQWHDARRSLQGNKDE